MTPVILHRHHPSSLRSLRRQHWIKWLQITTVFLWSLFPPFYTPAPAAYTPDSQSPPQPVWDGNGDEPESGPDLSDDDSDGLPNWFEQWLGSDIGNPDSDYDGLSDADEQYLTGTDPINWDSNSDGYSDHDAFYNCWAVNHNDVGFGQSVYDWDGDGTYNPQDPWPFDANNGSYDPSTSDSDGDGYADANDGHPYDYSFWGDWGTDGDSSGDPDPGEGNPEPPDDDADDDGHPDGQDSDPNDSTLWDDANRNGINDSAEIDPYTHDSDNDGFVDALDSNPWDPILWSDWNSNNQNDEDESGGGDPPEDPVDSDGDTVLDPNDSHPNNSSLWNDFNGNNINDDDNDPLFIDTDLDGVPDWRDSHPNWDQLWNDFNSNNLNDDHPTDDLDGDSHSNETDSHPSNSDLWEDWDNDGINDSDSGGGGGSDDSDSDNYPNHLDSHPEVSTLWSDWDFDSLNLDDELAHQTDPQRPDTDQDGLTDGEEVSYSTNPTLWDTDDDGLSDFEELRGTFGSNPRDAYSLSKNRGWGSLYDDWQMASLVDTDLDGIPNRIEELYGLNPNNPQDAASDLDGDGTINRVAYQQGKALLGIVDPTDRDGDGLTDVQEDFWGRRNPGLLSKFNPQDAVKDPDNDDLMNWQEVQFGSNPGIAVSTPHGKIGNVNDGTVYFWQSLIQSNSSYHFLALTRLPQGYHDSINDWMDTDYNPDANGSPTITPPGLQAFLSTVSPIHRLPGRKAPSDYDGDGMPDQWEWRYFKKLSTLDSADAGTPNQAPTLKQDPDSDALSNLAEFQLTTHPLLPDTDGDGFTDGLEARMGSSPTQATSLPSLSLSLSLVSGNSQSTLIDTVAPQPLTVATRHLSTPVPTIPVTFTVSSPTGGQISASPSGPWTTTVSTSSSFTGNAQVYWKAPASPSSSAILATLTGSPSQSTVAFSLNAINPPGNGGSGGSIDNPATTDPANQPPPPDGVYVFTSERYITGSFNGRSGGEEVIQETETVNINNGEQWYLSTPIPPPPRKSNDGFNGDADAAENLTDPLDPRDENLANAPVPPTEYLRTSVEPNTPGAQMIHETYEATRYTGNHSVTPIQPSGNYRAHNDINAIPAAKQNQTNSGTFQSTTLTNLMNGMPWMQGSNPQHGWRGDGKLGVRAKSANVSWQNGTHTITYSDPDGAGPGRTSTIHYQTADARHTQVRLQSSKPVIAEEGASRNFILIKTTTTLPESTDAPPPQVQTLGTITLKIPKNGTLSTTATPSSPSLAQYIKNQNNMAYIELRPTGFTLNQNISLSLLPIEFKNVRDVANAGDDVDITPKQNTTDTSINSVAWIDNHSSGTNDAPRMPQLRLSIPGLSSDMRIKAKLEVDYTRPYVGHQSEDLVRVPSNGNFREVTGSAWDIYNDADWTTAVGQGFFGGDATLTYQLTKADGTVVMQNQTILFRIAGQNPEDARCKDYIVAQSGTAWFAYALAKHESNLYGGEATYYPFTPVSPNNAKYNQFRALGGGQSGTRVAGREGIPLIERAEASGPGGIGMFQVTGSATDQTDIIPRGQLWNWQDNVNGALAIIQHSIKSGLATRYFNDLQNDPAPYPAAYQEDPPPVLQFGNTDFSSSDAIWITAYNGWGGPITPYPVRARFKFSPSLPPGVTIAPAAQTKRWFWNAPLNPDEFYIRKVERQLDVDPNTD